MFFYKISSIEIIKIRELCQNGDCLISKDLKIYIGNLNMSPGRKLYLHLITDFALYLKCKFEPLISQ